MLKQKVISRNSKNFVVIIGVCGTILRSPVAAQFLSSSVHVTLYQPEDEKILKKILTSRPGFSKKKFSADHIHTHSHSKSYEYH